MSLSFLKKSLENKNVKAFMEMLSKSEGTNYSDGYNYLFGSSPHNKIRFSDFSEHPNIINTFNNYSSSAAGKWQILFRTWEVIRRKYDLPDFSPNSQDIACVELISQRNVLQKLMDGHFDEALNACGNIWASLPHNKYGQPQHNADTVLGWYKEAGGEVA